MEKLQQCDMKMAPMSNEKDSIFQPTISKIGTEKKQEGVCP
jgi:hypothetical protein